MKRLRILAAALPLTALFTATAFADLIVEPRPSVVSWVVYCIPVVVIIVAIVLLRRAVKKRRLMNDGMQPDEPNDNNIR